MLGKIFVRGEVVTAERAKEALELELIKVLLLGEKTVFFETSLSLALGTGLKTFQLSLYQAV